MKLGARIFKTGIAIALALFLASIIGLPSPVFAGIAAIFAIQPSIYRSYLSVVEQVQANVVGAIIAIVFVMVFGNDPIIIGLAAIVVMGINIKLKIPSTIPVAIVTVIAIMENPGEDFILFSSIRFSTVLLGVLSAFVVNLVFLPPKYENKLYYKIVEVTEEIFKWIRINVRHASDHQLLKNEIDTIREKLIKLDQLYLFYKEERSYFKKIKYAKSRRLVLYRQMIVTTNRALVTLKKLHRFENELHHTPQSFQDLVTSELEHLLIYHEHMLLKFAKKVKTQPQQDLLKGYSGNKHVIDTFLTFERNEAWYHLFQLISAITDYYEQLEHLNKLLESFHQYHQEENDVEIEDKED